MNFLKKTTQKTAHTIAKQVREESHEILKSTTSQVSPQHESQPPSPAQTTKSADLNPAEIKRKEAELLNQWRSRVAEIQSEEARAREERSQSTEAWRKKQEELMKEPEPQEAPPVISPSKPRGPTTQGIQGALRRQQMKSELGRGTNN